MQAPEYTAINVRPAPTAPPYGLFQPRPLRPGIYPQPTAPPESPIQQQARVVPLPSPSPVPQVRAVPLPSPSPTSIERAFQPTPQVVPALAPALAPAPRRRPTTAPTVNPSTRFVASGSYGCVIDPALPNYNANTNSWKTFPNEVTKLFKYEDTKDAAVRASRQMYDATGRENNNILVHPYEYDEYRYRHLPGRVAANCGVNASYHIERMHPVHMKHLGVDATKLQPVVSEFQKIPVVAIMREMRRLMQQVVNLKRNGYIHGDIRETNVMFNHAGAAGTAGPKFTIIDYDWLTTADDFFARYPLGFYSNPPESFLHDRYDEFASSLFAIFQFARDIQSKIQTYVRQSNHNGLFREAYRKVYNAALFGPMFMGAVGFYKDIMHARTRKQFETALMETFDSYGLGLALCAFFTQVYARGAEDLTNNSAPYNAADKATLGNILNQLVTNILLPMCEFKPEHRITPEVAIQRIDGLIGDYERRMTPSLNALGGPIAALRPTGASAPRANNVNSLVGGRRRTGRRNNRKHCTRRQKK